MKDCLGKTDIRYDTSVPKDIVKQDPRWEKLTGYFRVNVTSFDVQKMEVRKPMGYNPSIPRTWNQPFEQATTIGYYNHTVDGSRLIINRYYFNAQAPKWWCDSYLPDGFLHAPPGYSCGEIGVREFAGVYAALNHENDGTLDIGRATGSYAPGEDVWDAGNSSKAVLSGEDTIDFSFVRDGFSSVVSFVFFEDGSATLSAVHTSVSRKQIMNTLTGIMEPLTEEEFIKGVEDINADFNIPSIVEAPMTSDEVLGLNNTFPTTEDWCGGILNDPSCTTSPYQEPDAQMKEGFIALFVILGVLVLGTVGYLFHRSSLRKQEKRYKELFVRGIAKNINIEPSAGMISADDLKKEFDHIDKDKGGTISKDELQVFVESGKMGTMKKSDFNAMWSALDIDGSGEIDFVEFTAFLSSCGAEFESVNKEQKAMTKAEKLKYASMRLSTKNAGDTYSDDV